MWYECYDVPGWPTEDDTSFCYAESTDGIVWTKPDLGLFSYNGSTANNILFRMIGPEGAHSRVHGTCVFKDPSAPPESRYKAVSQGGFTSAPPHSISWGSGQSFLNVAGMVSPDGIRWSRLPKPIRHEMADSQYSCFWDETSDSYVLYGRVSGRGRAVGRAESKDFSSFGELDLALQADDRDPPDSDIYNPAALEYPYAANAYFMFPSLYQHQPDTLDIRLAVSRDGIHWTRPDQETPFIPLGATNEFDSGSLYMGQGMLRVGDQIWQYYSGSPLTHNHGGEMDTLVKPENARVYSRVVSRLDGYVSADAGPEGGFFETPPLVYKGGVLRVNVAVRDGGSFRVGLLNENGESIRGRSIEDCQPVTGDHIDVPVRWKTGWDVSGCESVPTKVRVEMRNASLYAFQFSTHGLPNE
jgi:hypothetical protein